MPMRQHKPRVVSVRLTEDEYDALRKVCEAEELQSLSEFTRTAMKEKLAFRGRDATLLDRDLDALAKRLEKVYQELKATTEAVAAMLGHHQISFE